MAKEATNAVDQSALAVVEDDNGFFSSQAARSPESYLETVALNVDYSSRHRHHKFCGFYLRLPLRLNWYRRLTFEAEEPEPEDLLPRPAKIRLFVNG